MWVENKWVEKEIVVPKNVLQQIRDVLNSVAKAAPNLNPELVSAVNDARRQLFAILPLDLGRHERLLTRNRSTEGLSYDRVFQEGFLLGARAVMENYKQCSDNGASDSEAFGIAVDWLESRRNIILAETIDGADPEYEELEQAFVTGIEVGINRFLSFTRETYDDQTLPSA